MALVPHIPGITEIQNFDVSDFSTSASAVAEIDWDNKLLYIVGDASGKIKSVNLETYDTHDAAAANTKITGGPLLGEDGKLYGWTLGTNRAILHKVDPAALNVDVSTFGVASPAFTTDATHYAVPQDWDTFVSHGVHYLMSTAFDAPQTSNEMTVLDLDAMAWGGVNFNADEPRGVVTRGANFGGDGAAYSFATNNVVSMGMYRVTVNAGGVPAFVKVRAIPAIELKSSWTLVNGVTGCLLDEADGNLIVHVSGTPGSGTEYRIVKINATTGAVMWAIPVLGPLGGRVNSTRVRYGLYGYLDTSGTSLFARDIHFINTLTGTETTSAMQGVRPDNQFWDDFTGNWVGNASYGDFGTPTPHGTTPGIFAGWCTLGGFPKPSSTPPSALLHKQVQIFG